MTKQNLELKHWCKNFPQIRSILKELGAKPESVKKQVDYFFNLPTKKGAKVSPRMKLRIQDGRQVLVYYERPDFGKSGGTAADVKLYEVTDKKLLPFLEKALGVSGVVEKKRELWRKGNVVFHLDTIKNVGGVFEIELQKFGTITPSDRVIFAHYRAALLPLLGQVIKGSNIELVKISKKKYE